MGDVLVYIFAIIFLIGIYIIGYFIYLFLGWIYIILWLFGVLPPNMESYAVNAVLVYAGTGIALLVLYNLAKLLPDETGLPPALQWLANFIPVRVKRTSTGLIDLNELNANFREIVSGPFVAAREKMRARRFEQEVDRWRAHADHESAQADLSRAAQEFNEAKLRAEEAKARAEAAEKTARRRNG